MKSYQEEITGNYLKQINDLFRTHGIPGARVRLEISVWTSADGFMKFFYEAHVSHDKIDEVNTGAGDNDFERLLVKIERVVIPEIKKMIA